MGHIRSRSAAIPFRRAFSPAPGPRPGVLQAVAQWQPEDPMHCVRPAVLTDTAAGFVGAFDRATGGDVLYAVKCNPEPAVLRALWDGGVRHFDVASLGEVRLVRQMFPDAVLHFMHPVKSRQAIRDAYAQYGVRDFVLDDMAELEKILAETDNAADLGLIVRLALPRGAAALDLSGKFGAAADDAARLLRAARLVAPTIGVSFHVGSQMLDPAAWERALALAGRIIAESGVTVDVVDVGGGFPVAYPGETPPPLDDFMTAIARGLAALDLPAQTRIWCEPGRALVAAGASLVVQVMKRVGDVLYINDGVYGSLSDAGAQVGFRFPARLVRPSGRPAAEQETGFAFYGPTCDSADFMQGPFMLPADVEVGDWIEIGQLGAYGGCLRTAFNGFDQARLVEVSDPPLLETPGYGVAACVA